MIRLADYVMERLCGIGAKDIFTVTGRGILFLTDALAKHPLMNHVCVHHEQAAAYAAVAYSEYNNAPGACLLSTGCGATNAITGVLNAWQDGVPCVFISGQNMLNETVHHTGLGIRTFGSQEADIIPIVSPITKYAVMITDPQKIAYELDKAFFLAEDGVKGPVWIDIPLDVQNARIEPDDLERFEPTEMESLPIPGDLEYILEALSVAKRPVVLVGSGVRSADAIKEFSDFVEKIGVPVVYAHSAPDTYSTANPLSIGAVGNMYGTRAGNFAMQNADLLLIFGCRMTSMTTGSDKDKFARAAKTIVVDINPDEHTKNTFRIDKLIEADIKHLLSELLKSDLTKTDSAWIDKCLHWKEVFPKCEEKHKNSELVDLFYLAEALGETLPCDSVVVCDAGLEELILPSNVTFKKGMRCIHPAMQGSMGFALPGAVGAYMASKKPTCAVVGDGSIMMNLQELETIRYNKLPIKILVVNNNLYSVIRKRQQDLFRTRTIGTDENNGVSCPDFEKLADCFGLEYIRVDNSSELSQKLGDVFAKDSAVLCEIMAVEDQEYMHEGHTRNQNRKIVRRPIEDQEPFIDRELFLSEMVIDPIDQ